MTRAIAVFLLRRYAWAQSIVLFFYVPLGQEGVMR
jgi:hypothetical protein